MPLTNAERQKAFREKLKAGYKPPPKDQTTKDFMKTFREVLNDNGIAQAKKIETLKEVCKAFDRLDEFESEWEE